MKAKTVDVPRLLAMRKNHSVKEIAETLGVSKTAISNRIQAYVDYADVDWQPWVDSFNSGVSIYVIQSQSRIPLHVIRAVFADRRVGRPPKGICFRLPIQRIVELREKGLSYNRIAQMVGATWGGVRLAYLNYRKTH